MILIMMNQNTRKLLVATCLFISLALGPAVVQAQSAAPPARTLQALVDQAAKTTLEKFADKKLTDNQIAITLIDLRDAQRPRQASFRGNERVYPASVVKLFYLVAVHRWLEDGKIK